MQIRPTHATETPQLVELWERSVRATHSFVADSDIIAYRALVSDALAAGALEVWVLTAGHDDRPIGFLGLNGSCLEALFLEPACRGHGGGTQLVRHALALRPGGLTLDVNEQNSAAHRFYEALGFVVCGRSEVDGTGRPYPLLHMRWAGPSAEGMERHPRAI